MLKPVSCDVAVIGAGSAGLAAYHAAKATGDRVLLIEAGPGGTTCTRYGCMPWSGYCPPRETRRRRRR